MADDMKPRSDSSKDWSRLAGTLHSGLLSDVMDAMGHWGVLDPAVTCVNGPRRTILARAYTVRWKPTRKSGHVLEPQNSTWNQVKDFLIPGIVEGAGLVYVGGVEDGLLRAYALAGGFSATSIQNRGFTGMILGGAIRDAHVVKSLAMPVWSTNFSPADTQGNYQVAEIGTWCPIGNLIVHTGDWIFADETGALVVPSAIASEVFERATRLAGTENEIDRRASAGEAVFDIVADVGHL